jgi:hypothetical protein
MDTITESDLHDLATIGGEYCVSIYMPTQQAGREGQQDSVRLKNLVTAAEQQLIESGMRGVEAREFLAPIAVLPRQSDWEQRKSGLAIFRSQNRLAYYWLTAPLQESLAVGQRFYIRPLLPAIGPNLQFFVLAISRNQTRVLKATSRGYERIELPGLPTSMERALNLQTADRGEQVHSGMRGDLGKEAAVFHGQGGHRDSVKDEFSEYSRLVDVSLAPLFRQTPWPLILAGVDYEVAIFRRVSEYAHITEDALHGTYDYLSDQTLYEHALPIAQQYYGKKRQSAFTKYRTLVDRTLVSDDAHAIIAAACDGKIDTLLMDCSAEAFGRFDPVRKSIDVVDQRTPAFDLIDLAATQTIQHRGTVYAATRDELPVSAAMCAIFRY